MSCNYCVLTLRYTGQIGVLVCTQCFPLPCDVSVPSQVIQIVCCSVLLVVVFMSVIGLESWILVADDVLSSIFCDALSSYLCIFG